jgi:hypothetical protein
MVPVSLVILLNNFYNPSRDASDFRNILKLTEILFINPHLYLQIYILYANSSI